MEFTNHSKAQNKKSIHLNALFYRLNRCEAEEMELIRNTLLIRLLKIRRQPTIGFTLLGAHQYITNIHVSRYPEYPRERSMRRLGAAHSVAWKHHKREIQLGFRFFVPGQISQQEALSSNFGTLSIEPCCTPKSLLEEPDTVIKFTESLPTNFRLFGRRWWYNCPSSSSGLIIWPFPLKQMTSYCSCPIGNLTPDLHFSFLHMNCKSDVVNVTRYRSAVASFRCLTAMPPEGSTKAEIVSGFLSLDRGTKETGFGFDPRTFLSVNLRFNY
ncbi:hypothetical protein T265_01761 [Opisthorchis viverrini]|uniref:Uncharacterized protein n=1 Tax=Opisthorchis viverrini TaxID=6198 RepID=A0A075A1N1_OPIVI|nr:hypothetical protein T265_01761 [Opisthorchis viverrini]KER32142.1 hypothetical protein T265_01761 [Opisthorchis viverrini]